ncbi:hypothetical protein AFLA_009401 [Aspergillus flavus NRRL3357]|nr:hypothetical protein AFLA_009401 [Aspergillus flavus NRRL3357]
MNGFCRILEEWPVDKVCKYRQRESIDFGMLADYHEDGIKYITDHQGCQRVCRSCYHGRNHSPADMDRSI